jgi:hypothetical protein
VITIAATLLTLLVRKPPPTATLLPGHVAVTDLALSLSVDAVPTTIWLPRAYEGPVAPVLPWIPWMPAPVLPWTPCGPGTVESAPVLPWTPWPVLP